MRLGFASAFLSGGLSLTCALSTLGDPIFTDATLSAGLNENGFAFGDPIWGDFDNDGDLDLFVDNHYNRGSFFTRMMGMERLRISFRPQGLGKREISMDLHGLTLIMTVIWICLLLRELAVAMSLGTKQDELYRNLGAGQFTDIAEAAGVTNTWGRGRGVAWGDYDNDGHIDLLLGNLQTDLVLL